MLIAQISDPHLMPRGVLYQGLVDTNAMLAAAIAQVNKLPQRPDLVILSGDVVDGGTPAEYALAREMLAAIKQKLLVIPGNHDERAAFRSCFADLGYLPQSGPMHFVAGDHGPVRVIGLDVTIPGLGHGDMDDEAVAFLEAALALEPERPTMIMMHQPPFMTGMAFMDQYRCLRGQRLAEIVSRYPAVERIVCGHVHRSIQLRFGGTVLCTAPSTGAAIALSLGPERVGASVLEPPGLLLHHWTPGTGLVTHLVPIGDFPGPLPFA
jgi:Icc protein